MGSSLWVAIFSAPVSITGINTTTIPRNRAITGRRSRVSFRDSDKLFIEHPVETNAEYDRTAVEDHVNNPNLGAIFDELISFCECEMIVHQQSRASVRHPLLYGDISTAKIHVRRTYQDANRKLGVSSSPGKKSLNTSHNSRLRRRR